MCIKIGADSRNYKIEIPQKVSSEWLETALQLALKINNDSVMGTFAALYVSIAKCYEDLNNLDNAKKNYEQANSFIDKPSDNGPFYHGISFMGC